MFLSIANKLLFRFKPVNNLKTSIKKLSSVNKYFCTMSNNKITIGTHSGSFHCDEALACFMLKLLPEYKDAKIIRSRDFKVLDTCDIVVDVGGVYDPSKHRYDHHMRDFTETANSVLKLNNENWNIKLSSAGLVYCHFGHQILAHLLSEFTSDDINIVFEKIYDNLIKEIDAIDNGVPMFNEEPKYRINTHLGARVARLNPEWNSVNVDVDAQFLKAVELCGEEFLESVNYISKVWWPARALVKKDFEKRFEVDPSGEIMELTQFSPWKNTLYDLEKTANVENTIKYIIFKDDCYRVQCIPVAHGSFICRKFLPKSWAGLNGDELSRVSGIDDCVFVHSIRFIGGNKTREGALAMARKSLENTDE